MKTNKTLSTFKIIVLALVLAVGVQYVLAQTGSVWNSAPANPPAGNTSAPINVTSVPQTKTGPLAVGGLGILGDFTFLPSLGATVKSGQVLSADGTTGKVKWTDVAPTQSVSCTNVGGQSFISLNGNSSGNNTGIVINVGTLNVGSYTFSGSGQTYNVGGGGWAGVIVDSSPSLTYAQADSKLAAMLGGEPTTDGSGGSYKFYYNSGSTGTIIVMNKRNGNNDGPFTVPSETVQVIAGSPMYVYIVVGQASISGSLTINSSQNVCSGGGGGSSINPVYYYDNSIFTSDPVPNGGIALNSLSKVANVDGLSTLYQLGPHSYCAIAGLMYGHQTSVGNQDSRVYKKDSTNWVYKRGVHDAQSAVSCF